jgi:ankyrin repeat protein
MENIPMSQEFKPRLFKNRWSKEYVAHTVPRPRCHCADPQYYDDLKWSELQIHTEEQDTDCSGWQRLNELIDAAARDVNERIGRNGETALTLAAFKGATQIVQLLLDAGADVNVKTNGPTALIRAAICGQIKVTKFFTGCRC